MNKSVVRSGGRGFGLPPPEKFKSGYLPPGVFPVPRAMPKEEEDSGFGSDMDETTDSEEGVYGGRYSLDSSPAQVDMGPRRGDNSGLGHRYAVPLSRNVNSGSESICSDFSSSRETVEQMRGVRDALRKEEYSEDELSDSAMSSEDDSTRVGSSNGGATYTSEGYSSGVPSRTNLEKSDLKDFHERGRQRKEPSEDDIPSAPPLCGSDTKASYCAEQESISTVHGRGDNVDSNDSVLKKDSNISANETNGITSKKSAGIITTDLSIRNTAGAGTSTHPSSLPARLPTFHASGQGPWYSVISYDACVRLCLHLWARGCMEAPVFLENECELLQNAFGLQQVLLQPEEELLAKRSSGIISKGAAPKPKQIIGKMKVQVRKVKMALDPPTQSLKGCIVVNQKMGSDCNPSLNKSRNHNEIFFLIFEKQKSQYNMVFAKFGFVMIGKQHGSNFKSKVLAWVVGYSKEVMEYVPLDRRGQTLFLRPFFYALAKTLRLC